MLNIPSPQNGQEVSEWFWGMEGERGRKGFAPPLYKGGNHESSCLSPFKHTQWVGGNIWGGTGFFICR